MNKDMEARRAQREALAAKLREEHAPDLPETITNMIFNKAWDDGHANGEHEVDYAYDEIATIVNAAWKARRAELLLGTPRNPRTGKPMRTSG